MSSVSVGRHGGEARSVASGSPPGGGASDRQSLIDGFIAVRALSCDLAAPLSPEDMVPQSMEDASPTKWHLAHTTWFFETFLLQPFAVEYQPFDPVFAYQFNSYYVQAGPRHPRPQRGLVTRPGVAEVMDYRRHIDRMMVDLIADVSGPVLAELAGRIELGLHHEMQHQELILTDLLHLFSCNSLAPAYQPYRPGPAGPAPPLRWIGFEGGLTQIGHEGAGFAYDNETPRHTVYVAPYRLASRLVTNADWLAFIADGGYRTPTLWLSDGWTRVQTEGWTAPLYWQVDDQDSWTSMTLSGRQPVDPQAPVCHLSYYEADAFARWAGKRLPSEAEWELAAVAAQQQAGSAVDVRTGANLLGSGCLRPCAPAEEDVPDSVPAEVGQSVPIIAPAQMIGDVWEWTASPYGPYPGFRPVEGAIGEYNGKFMCNQMVLRGGSCVTPDGHVRPTYRNFFYPHQRWQFSGLRLAEDA